MHIFWISSWKMNWTYSVTDSNGDRIRNISDVTKLWGVYVTSNQFMDPQVMGRNLDRRSAAMPENSTNNINPKVKIQIPYEANHQHSKFTRNELGFINRFRIWAKVYSLAYITKRYGMWLKRSNWNLRHTHKKYPWDGWSLDWTVKTSNCVNRQWEPSHHKIRLYPTSGEVENKLPH